MDRPKKIPETPGVYMYKDSGGRIIYVGKAKNLRKRVSSYFRPADQLTAKTRAMMSHAASIEFLNTNSEKEALLLESSLIKKHRPHYNIVLRDDKQYIMFRLDEKAPFPRLEFCRKVKKDGARYFGPFTSGLAARDTWKAIHKTFALRRCSDRAMANRERPCLYRHIGMCLAPCTGNVTKEEYADVVKRVVLLLSGRSDELLEKLTAAMFEASDRMDYEKAAELRDLRESVRRTVEKQGVVLNGDQDADVLGLVCRDDGLALGIVFVRGGRAMDRATFFWPALSMEEAPELILTFLTQFYGPDRDIPPRIVLPWNPDETAKLSGGAEKNSDDRQESAEEEESETDIGIKDISLMLSEWRGSKVRILAARTEADMQLVTMAKSNAREAAIRRTDPSLESKLAAALHHGAPVRRIECVDISHTGGTNTKAGTVVYMEGSPLKSDYRVWNLEGCNGDDYAALTAWAERRLANELPWPDLMLIDGGRGQIASVHAVFSKAFPEGLPFVLAGIAKARDDAGRADRRAGNVSDRIFLPGRSNPLPIRPGSPEILYLQKVRDSAHDHVIGLHRQARAAKAMDAELTRLPGIGPATARLLWDRFKSIEAMRTAAAADIAKIDGIGPSRAAKLAEALQKL